MKRKNYLDFVLSGMTLIELLIVMAIMAILVAVSIPALKPMLESQRAANAARIVSLKLQQTRLKAMRENRPCGVEFIRFDNENRVSMQMRTVKNIPNFIQLNVSGYEVRCIVTRITSTSTAEIKLVKKKIVEERWVEIDKTVDTTLLDSPDKIIVATWKRRVLEGLSIQFNRQGKYYDLNDHFTIDDCSMDLPANQTPDTTTGVNTYQDAVEFNVTQRPSSMLNAITVLPRGTVIDLQHSGYGVDMQTITISDFNPSGTPLISSVVVMFSPAGYVDRFYVDGDENPARNKPFRGVFYFLVGEWDKIVPGEDGKNNLETPSNFWVTIKDHDGTVRTSPNANDTGNEKRHAQEDLSNNIGGL